LSASASLRVAAASSGGDGVPGGAGVAEDGQEVEKEALEDRRRHLLQRPVHPPVQLDLVVQLTQHVGDALLDGKIRLGHFERLDHALCQGFARRASMRPRQHFALHGGRYKEVPQEAGIQFLRIGTDDGYVLINASRKNVRVDLTAPGH
jgi:hypothetical protein